MQKEIRSAEFASLLTGHQRRLFLYILTLLPNAADAEEVLQEANAVLWAKANEFVAGTSFSAWAHKVAYFEVLAFRKRNQRDRLVFSDELLATFASEASSAELTHDSRRLALRQCLEKLPPRDRDLIARRYGDGTQAQQIATDVERPLTSIYRSLERARSALLQCLRAALAAEEGGS